MSSAAERSPGWNPWESRPHLRSQVVPVAVDGRWSLAAVVFPQRTGDGGLGVALVKALLDANIRSSETAESGRFPAQQKCPGAALTAPGVDSPTQEDRHARD